MKKLLILAVLSLCLYSCSDLGKKYSDKTFATDLESIKKDLSTEELEILGEAILRAKLSNENLEGKKYSEILDEGKNWRKQRQEKEKEEKTRKEMLSKAVTVRCVDKGFTEHDYDKYITYQFSVENKTEKNIKAVKGKISFLDLFGDKINTNTIKFDEPINAGKSITWNATTKYNQFIDADIELKNTELKDLKIVWQPEMILFEDGTSL